MKIKNIGFEYQEFKLSRNTKLLKFIDIYIQRSIYVFDLNYLIQLYGKSFGELIRDKIKDSSMFDLNDPMTTRILDYIYSVSNKGRIKVQLSTRLYIDGINKNIKIKDLIKKRKLTVINFNKKYLSDVNDVIRENYTRTALSRFMDIRDKNLDKDLLMYIIDIDKLKKYYNAEKLNIYILNHLSTYDIGFILSSLLSKYKNKNYLWN